MSAATLDLVSFQALQGSTLAFEPADGSEPVWLRLERLEEHCSPFVEGFVLLFSGATEAVLPQGTHHLIHPLQGRIPIFLGPVMGGGTGEVRYQAVFSRLKQFA